MFRQPWRRVTQDPNTETTWVTGRAGASVRASTWRNATWSSALPSCSGPLSSSNPPVATIIFQLTPALVKKIWLYYSSSLSAEAGHHYAGTCRGARGFSSIWLVRLEDMHWNVITNPSPPLHRAFLCKGPVKILTLLCCIYLSLASNPHFYADQIIRIRIINAVCFSRGYIRSSHSSRLAWHPVSWHPSYIPRFNEYWLLCYHRCMTLVHSPRKLQVSGYATLCSVKPVFVPVPREIIV